MNRLVLAAGLLLFSCTAARHNMKLPIFDKEGHRGCRALIPENTIPAMLKALELGVTTLETDAVITKDSVVVLSHEPFFNHEITTRPDGTFIREEEEKGLNIYHMAYSEVVRYDVGLKPHLRFPQQQKMTVAKPRLADMIDSAEAWCRAHRRPLPFYNIETKSDPATDGLYHPAPAEYVEILVRLIQGKGIEDRVIIQSFDFRTLQYLHRHYPRFRTAMLIEDFDRRGLEKELQDLGFTPTIYSPNYSLVNKDLVDACHARHIRIIPWTVDDAGTVRRLIDAGVDGIITEDPRLLE